MKIISLKQRSREWLKWRSTRVCASDAPIILGQSKFKTIEELYNEKIKCFETSPNPYMLRGIELESIALRKFEEETNLIMFPCVGVHDELDWMAASFDGVTICRTAICEIKCPGRRDHNEAMLGMIPFHYKAQLQHQIHVSGIDFAYYYSFDGVSGVIIEVKRDQEFIEKMIEKEFEFWQRLQAYNISKTMSNDYATTTSISGRT